MTPERQNDINARKAEILDMISIQEGHQQAIRKIEEQKVAKLRELNAAMQLAMDEDKAALATTKPDPAEAVGSRKKK